jgi:hypothetical protein
MNEDIIFNMDKFKALICYITDKCGFKGNFQVDELFAVLYFCDFNYYEIYEVSLTGEKYVKNPQGPLPVHFAEGELTDAFFDIPALEDDEIEVVDGALDALSGLDAAEHCRGDLPWRLALEDEELDYEAVFYREPEYSVRDYS